MVKTCREYNSMVTKNYFVIPVTVLEKFKAPQEWCQAGHSPFFISCVSSCGSLVIGIFFLSKNQMLFRIALQADRKGHWPTSWLAFRPKVEQLRHSCSSFGWSLTTKVVYTIFRKSHSKQSKDLLSGLLKKNFTFLPLRAEFGKIFKNII